MNPIIQNVSPPETRPAQGKSLKKKIDFYLNDLETPLGKAIDFVIIALILILCVTFVLTTLSLPKLFSDIIYYVETVIILIFIVEYIVRMWVAESRVRHFFNIFTLIDLISILPFFFTLTNLQFLRIFRVIRVFRILRFLRYLKDEYFFFGTIKEDNLIIVRIIFTLSAIIFVSSGLIYFEEHDHPDRKIITFFDALYFTVVTLTTVGFGDIVPVTDGGKIITILMIISGVVFLPWQIGTLIRKFLYTMDKQNVVCPKCGLKYHDKDAVHCKACGNMIYQVYDSSG
ncbi:MAG: ion transporter [bacterium]|nr:MAG: ion transporter [bacterium]